MTRQRLGWGMVALAGILLIVQLVPVLASSGRPAAGGGSATGEVRARATPLPGLFHQHRSGRSQTVLTIDRRAAGSDLELRSWQGATVGSVQLPVGQNPRDGWGLSQSPDGSRILDGTLLMDPDGRTRDLSRLIQQPRLSSFTWRDDSAGACAIQDDGDGGTSLVEFTFKSSQAELRHFPLPPEFGSGGQAEPSVLACSGTQHRVVIGEVNMVGAVRILTMDPATGAGVGHQVFPAGSAAILVASADGALVSLNSGRAPGWQTGPVPPTVVRDVIDGRVVRDFGTDVIVHSFSSDDQMVLVDSPSHAGTAIRRLQDGGVTWSDGSGRQLLGWLARPQSLDFAVALGQRDNNTCTRGEPGKFPQFCRFQRLQDLEVISAGGAVRSLGRGMAAWGYRVP